ncbi:hypothetical protein FPQ18DRAFT_390939 [Pyronema domesticum]|nr:hypothetical protein FPQ18DRAFT_390939 [Pyronema domesticum]
MNLEHLRVLKPPQVLIIDEEGILEFAREWYGKLSWNGRQIRNAFQTAIALGKYQELSGNESTDTVTHLKAKFFKRVAKTALAFEKYLVNTHGGQDDSDRAKEDRLRADYWAATPVNHYNQIPQGHSATPLRNQANNGGAYGAASRGDPSYSWNLQPNAPYYNGGPMPPATPMRTPNAPPNPPYYGGGAMPLETVHAQPRQGWPNQSTQYPTSSLYTEVVTNHRRGNQGYDDSDSD